MEKTRERAVMREGREDGEKRGAHLVKNWWLRRELWAMLFLGFSAGLPLLLIFSTLSVWLTEVGLERSSLTFFSWAALGYSFKFLWAPLVDLLPLPLLTARLGRRRSWMLVAQLAVILSIIAMSQVDIHAGDHVSVVLMALAAVALGFSSATQDIVIDAWRIESAEAELQAMLSSMYIAGYRIAMIVGGAGALFLADLFGTTKEAYRYSAWQHTYLIMAALMMAGVVTTLCIAEPKVTRQSDHRFGVADYRRIVLFFLFCAAVFVLAFFYGGQFFSGLPGGGGVAAFLFEVLRFGGSLLLAAGAALVLIRFGVVERRMVQVSYVDPVVDFFERYGAKVALVLLLMIGCYRLSDIVLGVISNVFYVDMGYTKSQIAMVAKTFGVAMTLAGSFLGGILTIRSGVYSVLLIGAVGASLTNLLFMLLTTVDAQTAWLTAHFGPSWGVVMDVELYAVIGADNLVAGIATAAFVAFLSSLTDVSFTAVQYAIFSSLMTLIPKVIGGYSGTIVEAAGYNGFFLLTALMGVPVIVLVLVVKKMMAGRQRQEAGQ